MRWNDFEHSLWKLLKSQQLEEHQNFILMVSGGLDSMVLLKAFEQVKPQASIKVVYYHHGNTENKEQLKFRDQCQQLVKKTVEGYKKNNISFHTEKSLEILNSEEQMRDQRWNYVHQMAKEGDIIVTAHHLDDHVETMMLKMIRGTGVEGFSAFQVWNDKILRPFLTLTKVELKKYADELNIQWVEDPSNKNTDYLRNWLREKWLVDLERRQTGAAKNLGLSLIRILSELQQNPFNLQYSQDNQQILSRQWFNSLSKSEKLRALSLWLKNNEIHNFTQGQLEEILKRLDKNQKDHIFEILGKKWVLNATQIVLN